MPTKTDHLKFTRGKDDKLMTIPLDVDPIQLAEKFDCFPLRVVRENGRSRLLVAMTEPRNLNLIADVEFFLGMSIIPVEASRSDITYLEQAAYFRKTWSKLRDTDQADANLFEVFSPTETFRR